MPPTSTVGQQEAPVVPSWSLTVGLVAEEGEIGNFSDEFVVDKLGIRCMVTVAIQWVVGCVIETEEELEVDFLAGGLVLVENSLVVS